MPPRPDVLKETTKPKYIDLRVRAVMQMLAQRRHTNVKIGHLAREVGVSHCHLSRLFSKENHKSPLQLLRQARFEKARELLRTTNLSVKEIMLAVGINDKSHFTRDFKRIYWLGPTQYRPQYGKVAA